ADLVEALAEPLRGRDEDGVAAAEGLAEGVLVQVPAEADLRADAEAPGEGVGLVEERPASADLERRVGAGGAEARQGGGEGRDHLRDALLALDAPGVEQVPGSVRGGLGGAHGVEAVAVVLGPDLAEFAAGASAGDDADL